MDKLYVIRSSKTNILGSGTVVFGFKQFNDVRLIANKMRSINTCENIWYTSIKHDKFVMTSSSYVNELLRRPKFKMIKISMIESTNFLQEIIEFNLSIRLIDSVTIDNHNFYTLNSASGYEPFGISNDDNIIMLEKNMLI